MMFARSLCFLALTATATLASSEVSPLFRFASTADLSLPLTGHEANKPVSDVHQTLWQALSSCPTKHYAVIIEPNSLFYPRSASQTPLSLFKAQVPAARTMFEATNIEGKINIDAVMNTILMDCLHYGVLRAEELDTRPEVLAKGLPALSPEILRKSIIYARLPEVSVDWMETRYEDELQKRKQLIENVIGTYFEGEHYTLIHIVENEEQGKTMEIVSEEGSEIPLVNSDKA